MIKAVRDLGQVWDSQNTLIPVIPATTLADKIVENAFAPEPVVWSYPALNLDGEDLAAALEVTPKPWVEFRQALTRSAPYVDLNLRRKNLITRARLAFQKALFVRALFPKDFPEIMNATSEASRSDAISLREGSSVDYLRNCARSNSIIK
jgi:hypothetical protein